MERSSRARWATTATSCAAPISSRCSRRPSRVQAQHSGAEPPVEQEPAVAQAAEYRMRVETGAGSAATWATTWS